MRERGKALGALAWGWRSPAILGLLAAAAGLLIVFVRVELRRRSPMLDLSLFTNHVFSASSVSALLNYACVYALLFLLIQDRGLDAEHAGFVLTAQPVVMAIVAPFSGSSSDRVGTRWPAILGMLILAAGLLIVALLVAHCSLWAIAAGLAGHSSSPSTALIAGVRASLLVSAGLALAGAGTSALR